MLLNSDRQIRFSGYTLDREAWQLSWRGEPISLSRKTFDLLLFLVEHRTRVVPKDELLQALWPEQFVEENNLAQQIFLLRKALSRHDSGLKLIETIPGRGYRFMSEIEADLQPAQMAEPVSSEVLVTTSASVTDFVIQDEIDPPPTPIIQVKNLERRHPWRTRWIFAAATLVVLGSLAGWFGFHEWFDRQGGPPVSVGLVPGQGRTGDAVLDQALLAALRADLSQSPFVSVVPSAKVRDTLTEMKQNPDVAMTPAVSSGVCERTNSQATLTSDIVRIGQHFLLHGEVTSCVNGATLASAKYEARNMEDLPGGIDHIAKDLRHDLGESRRSIARFDVPLLGGHTASLEALENYSQATLQADQGKYVDATELVKKAIAADPDFPEAYYALAAYARTLNDFAVERDAIVQAYRLRDSASESMRLAITALYHSGATQNLYEAERNYQSWTDLYPHSAAAWNGLSVVERELGHHLGALDAGKRALSLTPRSQGYFANVAYEQAETGDPRAAIGTCESAIAKGIDGDHIRGYLFVSAYTLHDTTRAQQQLAWASAHPDTLYVRLDEVEIAIAEGRFSDARRLLAQLEATMRRRGLSAPADDIVRAEGINLMEAGDFDQGQRLFRSVPLDPHTQIAVLGLARSKDPAAASAALKKMQTEFPQGTIWNEYLGPEIQAINALTEHRPNDAIAALERIRSLEGRDTAITMMRADAYLAKGDARNAELNYRLVVGGPQKNATSEEVPLSWLGLGRALAAQGERSAALDAYGRFLKLWANADPSANFLLAAKSEVATLQAH